MQPSDETEVHGIRLRGLLAPLIAGALVVFGLSAWLFHTIFFTPIYTDLQEHAYDVLRFGEGELGMPANFLYYGVIWLLSGMRAEWEPLFRAGTFALGAATAARFALDYGVLAGAARGEGRKARPLVLLGLALAVTLSFSLPTFAALEGKWYLGQTPPNVWHNSTTIFVMPFAIALFWAGARNLERPALRLDAAIAGLAIVNVATKPSFFLAFAPGYGLMLLLRFGFGRAFWARTWPVVIGAAAVGVQYYFVFALQQANRYQGASSVTFEPFAVWSHHSPSIPLSLVASLLFPVVAIIAYWRRARGSRVVQLAAVLYLVGIAMMALLAETGPRRNHGNFFWQSYLCSHVLFLAAASLLSTSLAAGRQRVRDRVVIAALALHVVAGIAYLGRMLTVGEIF